VLHLSRKLIVANLKIWCSKMQPFSGNLLPDLRTSLMDMSLILRVPHEMPLLQIPFAPTNVFDTAAKPSRLTHFFDKVRNPLRLPRKTTLERPKVVRSCGAF
jgi:hypothetical protein